MEIINLANFMFGGHAIRIYGTRERPLFIAEDVGAILGMSCVRTSIRDFEPHKKEIVHGVDTPSGKQSMIALTEYGLYTLILRSRLPAARVFEKWLFTEVLPAITSRGYYSIYEETIGDHHSAKNINTVELQSQHSSISSPLKWKKYDLVDYRGLTCIYLVYIADNDYKYGRSSSVNTRIQTHMRKFKERGYTPKLVRIWKCESSKVMNDVEGMITEYATWNGILADSKKHKQREIITTNDVKTLIDTIDKYISRENSRCMSVINMRAARTHAKHITMELTNESKRIDLELYKLEIHGHHSREDTTLSPSLLPVNPPLQAPAICHVANDRPSHVTDPLITSTDSNLRNSDVGNNIPPASTTTDIISPTVTTTTDIISSPTSTVTAIALSKPVPPPTAISSAPIPVLIGKKGGKVLCECGKMITSGKKAKESHIKSKEHIRIVTVK